MANSNIINAVFGSGLCAVTTSAFRANYGMVLRFSGIDLPTAFEVDFSNYDVMGRDSITMIGQNGEVQIPDNLWDSGLNIYAYVYLHPTDDSGVTVYTVTIPVLGRPNRTEETPTPHEQSVIEQAISALNDAVEQTAADVVAADASASAAAQSKANAATSERSAAASAGSALASQNAAESASQSATESASGAAESARNAAQSASTAAESATNAQASAEQAEQSVQSIGDDVERAERAATTATDNATAASGSAATASTKATEAATSAQSADSAAQNAASSATAAESSATDAEQAKSDAQDAQAAAEQAKDDAVSAADRAEQAEQEVLSAMDGTHENLTSGNAQQLLSTVTEANSVPYLFRQTASNADRAYLDDVVGGTVAWNQLVSSSATSVTIPNGRKYVSYIGGSWGVGTSTGAAITVDGTNGDMAFDLTLMFGSTIADYIYSLEQANAGAGVAYFRKLFPNDYYEYNSGELLSVEGVSAKRTVGFNQWDEEWEVGSYSSTGQKVPTQGGRIRSVNKIAVSPSTSYYALKGVYILCQYDENEEFVSFTQLGTDSPSNVGHLFTTEASTHYITFATHANYGATYNHDICINLSDPTRNGTYEPYTERTYPLDSSLTLRGIPKKLDASGNLYYDGDTYAADGTVTRKYGIVDLGALDWMYYQDGILYTSSLRRIAKRNNKNLICPKYVARDVNLTSPDDLSISMAASGQDAILRVCDKSYSDAATFKTAMSGVMLVYELATPTTETAEPYRHLQICDPNGTEEFVSTGIVPVGHNTRYPENLRAKIEGLPWNFNSIIAMTETTTTASKAYSVGDYFILNNVLYRVTSAIASGGTITIGTNCRATTIMDEIKALS